MLLRITLQTPRPIPEPQARKRHALPFTIPVRHCETGNTFGQSEEAVGVEEQAPVDELVVLGAAGRAQHHVGFGLFVGEGRGGGAVC